MALEEAVGGISGRTDNGWLGREDGHGSDIGGVRTREKQWGRRRSMKMDL